MGTRNLIFYCILVLALTSFCNGIVLFPHKMHGYHYCALDISSYNMQSTLTTEQRENYQKVITETEMILLNIQKFIDVSQIPDDFEDFKYIKKVKIFDRQKFVKSCVIHLYIFNRISKSAAFEYLKVLYRSYVPKQSIWPTLTQNMVISYFSSNANQTMDSLMLPNKWKWPIKFVIYLKYFNVTTAYIPCFSCSLTTRELHEIELVAIDLNLNDIQGIAITWKLINKNFKSLPEKTDEYESNRRKIFVNGVCDQSYQRRKWKPMELRDGWCNFQEELCQVDEIKECGLAVALSYLNCSGYDCKRGIGNLIDYSPSRLTFSESRHTLSNGAQSYGYKYAFYADKLDLHTSSYVYFFVNFLKFSECIFLVLSVILISAALYIVGYSHSFLWVITSTLEQSNLPHRTGFKIQLIVAPWFFAGLIMRNTYTTKMFSMLTRDQKHENIPKSYEDVINQTNFNVIADLSAVKHISATTDIHCQKQSFDKKFKLFYPDGQFTAEHILSISKGSAIQYSTYKVTFKGDFGFTVGEFSEPMKNVMRNFAVIYRTLPDNQMPTESNYYLIRLLSVFGNHMVYANNQHAKYTDFSLWYFTRRTFMVESIAPKLVTLFESGIWARIESLYIRDITFYNIREFSLRYQTACHECTLNSIFGSSRLKVGSIQSEVTLRALVVPFGICAVMITLSILSFIWEYLGVSFYLLTYLFTYLMAFFNLSLRQHTTDCFNIFNNKIGTRKISR